MLESWFVTHNLLSLRHLFISTGNNIKNIDTCILIDKFVQTKHATKIKVISDITKASILQWEKLIRLTTYSVSYRPPIWINCPDRRSDIGPYFRTDRISVRSGHPWQVQFWWETYSTRNIIVISRIQEQYRFYRIHSFIVNAIVSIILLSCSPQFTSIWLKSCD